MLVDLTHHQLIIYYYYHDLLKESNDLKQIFDQIHL